MTGVCRDEILRYLDEYLSAREFRDYGPQGLQVEGKERVQKVVSGVSGSVALFEAAAAAGADLVIVHHGIFWDRESRVVKGGLKRRLGEAGPSRGGGGVSSSRGVALASRRLGCTS